MSAEVSAAASLPDGRGYELVSPPETGAIPAVAGAIGFHNGFDCFETNLYSPSGEGGIVFGSEVGSLGGLTSNGVLNLYEARRTPDGWLTESKSASGLQTTQPAGGLCLSPDHQYSTFLTGAAPGDRGSLVMNGAETSYIRNPLGGYELVGSGTIATDPMANVKWIANAGSHIVFTSQKRLIASAPAGLGVENTYTGGGKPVNAVYDRTPDGLRVVSLLPSGLAPNSSSETTFYRSVSTDGTSVVFEVVKNGGAAALYEHPEQGPSVLIASGGARGDYRFSAISSNGDTVVYMKQGAGASELPFRGDIYVFDRQSGASTPITTGTEAAIVNVSDDCSTVYFTSSQVLPGSGENQFGASAELGAPNLYVWRKGEGGVRFVATVMQKDIENQQSQQDSLTEWMSTIASPQQDQLEGRLNDPSRTTPDGSVFVFESRANITGYDSGGSVEIYRYHTFGNALSCVSCPSSAPAESDAALQREGVGPVFVFNALARVDNVTDDGKIVFFMTGDALTPEDKNEAVDVYEWNEGVVSLISGGQGPLPSVLYAMSPDGKDVFFVTGDRLVPQDPSSVLSIYDARKEGGFPFTPPVTECVAAQYCPGSASGQPGGPKVESSSAVGAVDPQPKRKGCHKRHKHKKKCLTRHRHRGGAR